MRLEYEFNEKLGKEDVICDPRIPLHGPMRRRMSWKELRAEVFTRDKGICHVCTDPIEPNDYHCGHIVDRCRGGRDELSNLVAMHNYCNMIFKPVHATRLEYMAWWVQHYIWTSNHPGWDQAAKLHIQAKPLPSDKKR